MKHPRGLLRLRAWTLAGLLIIAPALLAAPRTAHTGHPTQSSPISSAAPATPWTQRPDVRTFIEKMVQDHGFDALGLHAWFDRSGRSDQALALIAPPPPGFKRVWTTYRSRFVEPKRLREGDRFWREHSATLRQAAQQWGVPESILVAIIGVETFYGRQTGRFRVMDVLTTLAFEDPRRARYFQSELEQFLLLMRDTGTDPLTPLGSFAGAMGLPQFMPSSIRRHAVDFNQDGRIDLLGSPADAIGSVARFLAAHGWQPGQPTHFAATVTQPERAQAAVAAGLPPRLSLAELNAMGVQSPAPTQRTDTFSLIDLPNGEAGTDYVLGAHNFWVITRYNRSYFYAMAVIDLAQALATQRTAALAAAPPDASQSIRP